jgi:hypothetical protein
VASPQVVGLAPPSTLVAPPQVVGLETTPSLAPPLAQARILLLR